MTLLTFLAAVAAITTVVVLGFRVADKVLDELSYRRAVARRLKELGS